MINNNANLYSLKKLLIYIIYKEVLDRLVNNFFYNTDIFFVIRKRYKMLPYYNICYWKR